MDSATGFTQLVLRVVLWVLFYHGAANVTGPQLRREGASAGLQHFLKQLTYIGTFYFLSFPAVCFVSSAFVANEWRHGFVSLGNLLCQMFAMLAFSLPLPGGKGRETKEAPQGASRALLDPPSRC